MNLSRYLKNFIKQFFYFFLGFFNFPKSLSSEDIFKTFKNKKVLILGSGESLSGISQDILNKYEKVIAINNAIEIVQRYKIKDLYLYSTDTLGICSIKKNQKIKPVKTILFPQQTNKIKEIYFLCKKYRVLFIRPNLELKWVSSYLRFLKFPIISAKLYSIDETYRLIVSKEKEIRPLLPFSSFYSLFIFLVKYKAKNIASLGIDFRGGYSKFLSNKEDYCPHEENDSKSYWEEFSNFINKNNFNFQKL